MGKKAPKPLDTPVEIKLVPSDEIHPTREYSNYILVSHSPHDFSLKFCDATPVTDINKVKQNGGNHYIPVVREIAISPNVIPGLIKALQDQFKKYRLSYESTTNGKKTK